MRVIIKFVISPAPSFFVYEEFVVPDNINWFGPHTEENPVPFADGFVKQEGEEASLLYCTTSGAFVGTAPNCTKVEGLAGIATGVLAQMSTDDIVKKMTSSELKDVLKVLEDENTARGGGGSNAGSSSSPCPESYTDWQFALAIILALVAGLVIAVCVRQMDDLLGWGRGHNHRELKDGDEVEMGGRHHPSSKA